MFEPHLKFVLLFVSDPQTSAEFYSTIFNLKPVELSPTFALFALTNGVMLGLWSNKTAEPKVEAQPVQVRLHSVILRLMNFIINGLNLGFLCCKYQPIWILEGLSLHLIRMDTEYEFIGRWYDGALLDCCGK
jgi:hypothetical protein